MAVGENTDTSPGVNTKNISRQNPDAVNVISREAESWIDKSILPRTLLNGTRGMKAASTAFLPKHTLESDAAYERRLDRSTLLNAFRKTSSFLAGQVFQSDIIFEDGIEEDFLEWAKKIDAAGNSLDVFGKRIFQNGIAKGVAHILIDMPKKDPNIKTKADEKKAGIRPYFKEIDPKNILGAIVDEDGFLIQVRISESVTKRVGNYGTETVERIRVLEPGKWEIFEIDSKGASASVDSGEFSIKDIIPIVTFIPGEEWTIVTGETPIMDLAELNNKHWRLTSEIDHMLGVAMNPILFGKNIEIAEMPVGVATMVTSTDENADMKYIEASGLTIKIALENVKEVEAQMALYGLQQLLPRKGNMTATEKALTSSESNSSLGTWATEFESFLIAAFKIAGQFVEKEFTDGGISVNKEYSFGVADPQELAQILKSQEQGILSAQACFTEFRRRGIFDEHMSWDDIEADIEQEQRDRQGEVGSLAGSVFGEKGEGDEEGV